MEGGFGPEATFFLSIVETKSIIKSVDVVGEYTMEGEKCTHIAGSSRRAFQPLGLS